MAYNQQPPGYSPYSQQPQQGYPPQQQQYPPQQGGYQPGPAYAPQAQQQSSNNVVVVQSQPSAVHTTVVQRDSTNHLLHFIICLFCPWWIFVWLLVCCIQGV